LNGKQINLTSISIKNKIYKMKNENEKYCQECGEVINIKAEICPKCGVRQTSSPVVTEQQKEQQNKWLVTLLLCWFLGIFGVHRFYTGHTTIGIIQLLTLGGCGIWVLVDFIIIIMGNFKDAQGNPIKN
jgi:TM2 domain-containing membrane protein YozV/ribosomal protein L40E